MKVAAEYLRLAFFNSLILELRKGATMQLTEPQWRAFWNVEQGNQETVSWRWTLHIF